MFGGQKRRNCESIVSGVGAPPSRCVWFVMSAAKLAAGASIGRRTTGDVGSCSAYLKINLETNSSFTNDSGSVTKELLGDQDRNKTYSIIDRRKFERSIVSHSDPSHPAHHRHSYVESN